MLYGTTAYGGSADAGTAFEMTTTGLETMLYSFQGGQNGMTPTTSLLHFGGGFYGMTVAGGTGSGACTEGQGCRTLFRVTESVRQRVEHSFGHGHDGYSPITELATIGGTIYGTTQSGGKNGYGTVFQYTSP
jgi:uncharacterized repeat protein (TIGR03803 family)